MKIGPTDITSTQLIVLIILTTLILYSVTTSFIEYNMRGRIVQQVVLDK